MMVYIGLLSENIEMEAPLLFMLGRFIVLSEIINISTHLLPVGFMADSR